MTKIYIAGAHSRGVTTGHYLKYLDASIEIIAYLYDNNEDNPKEVDGIPVLKIDKNSRLDTDAIVYLGMRSANMKHIMDTLLSCGMKHIIPVDVAFDMELRNRFLQKYFSENNRIYDKIYDYESGEYLPTVLSKLCYTIYVVNSIYDKVLKSGYNFQPYERKIQVGTALTDERLAVPFFDNVGDNISDRNKQFCELTALYWIWKNATEDIVGLVHYRRHFILPDDWVNIMRTEGIDVILPVPLYVQPSIENNYRDRHIGEHWDNMLEYIKRNDSVDYGRAKKFFTTTGIYSPCNMIIARKKVLDELCDWIFPILFYVADRGGIIDDSYQNRYPGFLSERLMTYFFEKNRDKYRVVYADKNFLE